MTDDHVLHQCSQPRWKIRQRAEFIAHHAQREHHVTQQLPFGGVPETAVVAQLVNLTDVVKHHPGQQQVETHAVMLRRHHAQPAKRQHVFEQSAQPSVVDLLSGGRLAIPLRDFRIIEDRFDQRLQVRISHGAGDLSHFSPHLIGIAG